MHGLWSTRISLPTALPAVVAHAPHPPPHLKLSVQVPEVRPRLVVPPPTVPQTPRPQPDDVVQPPKVAALPSPPEPAQPRKLEPQTRLGEFGSTSSAAATVKLPRPEVQTGGFGSPSGLPGAAEGGSHGNVAHLGSFDQPVGPGSGNGSGGEHGARGVVASAGFGNNAAQPAGVQGAGDGQVRSGGFADARSLTQTSPQPKPQPAAAALEPVEITSKPNPVYTEEARRLHIQGEVILRVVFRASGQIQVLGVNQGLGHGLDEAAIRAAQEIQFKPARRNGQPTDTTATLQIVFQLAN